MDALTAWIGLIGAVVGGALTAISNYFVQRQRLKSERDAERDRWRREDETRNIDERRQTYTDFLENARWMLEKIEDLDVALKDLAEVDEVDVPPGPSRERIEATIDRVEQLQKDLRWDINGAYTLLTKIEIFGHEPVPEAARNLFTCNRELFEAKEKIANESLKLSRAQVGQGAPSALNERSVYRQHYEYDRDETGKVLKDMSKQSQQYFNDAVRRELGIPSV